MIQVSSHVARKGGIYYLTTSRTCCYLTQTEHIASEISIFLFTNISYSFTYNLAYILNYDRILLCKISDEKTESINLWRCYINIVSRLFIDQSLFLFLFWRRNSWHALVKIFLDIFECYERNHFRLDQILFILWFVVSFLQVKKWFFGDIIIKTLFFTLFIHRDCKVALPFPFISIVLWQN